MRACIADLKGAPGCSAADPSLMEPTEWVRHCETLLRCNCGMGRREFVAMLGHFAVRGDGPAYVAQFQRRQVRRVLRTMLRRDGEGADVEVGAAEVGAEAEAEAEAGAEAEAKAKLKAAAKAAAKATAKATAAAAAEAAAEAAVEAPPQPHRCAYCACTAAGRRARSFASGWTACAGGAGAGWPSSSSWTDRTSSSCPETRHRPGAG